MRKIIVITKSNAYGDQGPSHKNYKLNNEEQISTHNICSFYLATILSKIGSVEIRRDEVIKKFNEDNDNPVKSSIFSSRSNKTSEKDKTYRYNDKILKYSDDNCDKYCKDKFEGQEIYQLYESKDKSDKVIFVYWDNIPTNEYFSKYSEHRIELIDAIVKDCNIEESGINQLYIHHSEWGGFERDAVLVKNNMINKSEAEDKNINYNEATELANFFQYVASFRHVGTANNSTIFGKIKLFDFDMGSAVTVKCADADKACKSDFKDAFNRLSKVQ